MTMPDNTVVTWFRDNWLVLGLCITLGVMYSKINQSAEMIKILNEKYDKKQLSDEVLKQQVLKNESEIKFLHYRLDKIENEKSD